MAVRLLVERGNAVVLHACNEARSRDAMAAVPGAEAIVVGDLASIAQTRGVANQANALGAFDAAIHNAAVGFREHRRIETEGGLAHVFGEHAGAPTCWTALIRRSRRLVDVISELHRRGDASLDDLNWECRPWRGNQACSDARGHA